ncbi:hypothetical protein [Aureimonas ureilytica]|uniref:hypothetical protein n=1 Tax=Aureimonas ureilytica TaxID=401562 RepID=UPI00073456B3|nr:hypothetical protein [Aureimonas ureilytica]
MMPAASTQPLRARPTRLFVFGCGYSAKRFVEGLAREDVSGVTTRSPDKSRHFASAGLVPFLFDGTGPGEGIDAVLAETTHLLISIAPGPEGDPVLRHHGDAIRSMMPELEWIGYLSTVGVYGDHGGAWVDETTQLRPVSQRSRERVEAEALSLIHL